MISSADFGKVAALCHQYVEAYDVWQSAYIEAKVAMGPRTAKELTSLLVALEKAISPITFVESLEAQQGPEEG